MSFQFPKFLGFGPGDEAGPQMSKPGGHNQQPTGARTVGDGSTAQIASPEMAPVDGGQLPAGPPIGAQRQNIWTDQQGTGGIHGGKITAWIKQAHEEHAPLLSAADTAALADQLLKLERFDSVILRVRERLALKYWERRGGSATATGGAAAGMGLGSGTAGAATIQPARCLLDMIHNPSATAPATVALGELDGDPVPKLQVTIAAGGFAPLPAAGLLFNHGIVLLASTLPLTFCGRTLD